MRGHEPQGKARCLGLGGLFAQTWQLELMIPEKSFPSLLPKRSVSLCLGSCHSLITANSSSLSAAEAGLSNWVGAEEA